MPILPEQHRLPFAYWLHRINSSGSSFMRWMLLQAELALDGGDPTFAKARRQCARRARDYSELADLFDMLAIWPGQEVREVRGTLGVQATEVNSARTRYTRPEAHRRGQSA